MRLSRTDFFPILTIIAGGIIGASFAFGALASRSGDGVPARARIIHEVSGLVAYYPLDGNADDASGNGHDGDVYGATLLGDRNGATDQAYHLDNFDYIALDADAFDRSCAVLGAQRHCKVIGIFTRLGVRDGKPGYHDHIPRVWRLLEAALAHPALADVAAWLDAHVPPDKRIIPA